MISKAEVTSGTRNLNWAWVPTSGTDVPNVQPAYAEGFGVAGAHLSRRSESEGGTSNSESFRE